VASTVAAGERDGQLRRRLVGIAYAPALALGGLAQLVAIGLGSPALAAAGLVLGGLADLATADEFGVWRGRLRRIGLGVVQRASLRSLLLLAAITSQTVPSGTAMLFVVATIGAVVASRTWRWALEKVVATEPAMGARNLGGDGTLTTLFDRTRRRRTVGSGALVGAELPVGLAMLAGAVGALPDEGVRLVLVAVTVVVAAVAGYGLWWSVSFRRSGRVERHLEALRAELERHGAPVIAYFSGGPGSTYQLNQWLPVYDRLTVPVLVVIRERHHLNAMKETRWPVLYCRTTRDVEEALTPSARVALYVANAGRNIHLQRYPQLRHVFLNHGDSDKASSANPVVRVYDDLFVAGELGVDRYRQGGVDIPRERFHLVGRPQLDDVLGGGERVGEGPPTLLYAPTWEGYFEEADYSSVERVGVALVRRILEQRPDVRIVFKPHPLSGVVRPASRTAVRQITELLRERGAPHELAADHPELDLLAWFDRADVLLADISAVVTDWLATDKPYLVTNPRDLPLDEFRRRFPSHTAAYVVGTDLATLDRGLEAAFGDDPLADQRLAMRTYVLGAHPDGPQATFDRVVREVIDAADRRLEATPHLLLGP
jgi:hypothetical protein